MDIVMADVGEGCNDLLKFNMEGKGGTIAIIRLNRLSRSNAYNATLLDLLEKRIRIILEENTVRVLILTGEGSRSFCAGADRDELRERRALDGLNLKSQEIFELIATLPLPTIAAINGAAVGGGLELALACDLRVCAPGATLFLPEVGLGLSPAAGGGIRLPAVIGKSRAKEMILFGRKLDAQTALEWGLVSYVGDDFEAYALGLARSVVDLDPMAVRLAKKVIESDNKLLQHDLASVVQALLYELKFNKEQNE